MNHRELCETAPKEVLLRHASWCARRALERVPNPDPRSFEALDVVERFIKKEVTLSEVITTSDLAYSAIMSLPVADLESPTFLADMKVELAARLAHNAAYGVIVAVWLPSWRAACITACVDSARAISESYPALVDEPFFKKRQALEAMGEALSLKEEFEAQLEDLKLRISSYNFSQPGLDKGMEPVTIGTTPAKIVWVVYPEEGETPEAFALRVAEARKAFTETCERQS